MLRKRQAGPGEVGTADGDAGYRIALAAVPTASTAPAADGLGPLPAEPAPDPQPPALRPTRPLNRTPWAAGLALGLGLSAVAAVALALQLPGQGWPLALALLLCSGAAALAGLHWQALQHERARHALWRQQQLLQQLVDGWLWQTDADHRLVRLQAPARGLPSADPASAFAWPGAAPGQCLWRGWQAVQPPGDDGQPSPTPAPLQPLLERQTGFDAWHGRCTAEAAAHDSRCDTASAAAPAPRWRLRAVALHDEQGRFCGHLGSALPCPVAAPPAVAPASDADDSSTRSLAAEHASFAYTISHDLRAPIRVVDGFARILKEDHADQLDRVARDHVERILGAAARMNHMIDALLSLSQLSTRPLAAQRVNLSQLAGFVVEELRRCAPARAVQVQIAPQLWAHGDPTLLRLVLENLLGNAWKYSAKVAEAEIRFEQVHKDGRTAFVISDNGAGFDMRFADRLFGVFQRLHSSSDFAGTGVGLASVRRIVRRHGGDIWAEGEVGRGARFYFTLKG